MDNQKSILILGAGGMVGSALVREAEKRGYREILAPRRAELDLLNQQETQDYLASKKPSTVLVAAARVGGIHANDTYPAEFLYENLTIASNAIHSAYTAGVKRLLFLGSSCIYPKYAPQPMKEDCLLSSALEPTNEAYAIAKIAGLKLCQYYRKQYGVLYYSAMPTNLYGEGDNYHPENSHVIPAMLRRFHEAKQLGSESVTVWGTGTPRREFLYVDDLADGCFHLLEQATPEDWVNLGYGEDVSIMELAQKVAQTVGYEGDIRNDLSKPDGTPKKLMDPEKMRSYAWTPKVTLGEGLQKAYQCFLRELEADKLRSK